jgi:lysophospholipase L1-like esterase
MVRRFVYGINLPLPQQSTFMTPDLFAPRCLRAVLIWVLALVGACAPQTGPVPDDRTIAAELRDTGPLVPFYRALAGLEQRQGGAPVVILQIGDSHTANDAFSGRLRELFQARFGDAGRGVLPPGIPYRYYRPDRVSVTETGWTRIGSLTAGTQGPFGIAGLRQHADRSAAMSLTVGTDGEFDRVEVELLRQPGGGTAILQLDTGDPIKVSTADSRTEAMWVPIPATSLSRGLTVRATGDGAVDVLAWRIARGQPGVIYANLGTIGASVNIMDRWDPQIVGQELRHLSPALIVLAFGTNEGFRDGTVLSDYAETFAARLRALHEAAPSAAILVIGPPDGARHPKSPTEASVCHDPHWATPPQLGPLRAIEQASAARAGAFFWDWSGAMGGPCSMIRWAASVPPLAAPDHVHLFAPGYRATAEKLFDIIMQGYDRYLALRRTA